MFGQQERLTDPATSASTDSGSTQTAMPGKVSQSCPSSVGLCGNHRVTAYRQNIGRFDGNTASAAPRFCTTRWQSPIFSSAGKASYDCSGKIACCAVHAAALFPAALCRRPARQWQNQRFIAQTIGSFNNVFQPCFSPILPE
ncbi:hypothetical protein [Escherichia coli]|uniref:hypothetical protein n=1 Tax=Escherichia coli TaxID=562 RepID=UPI0019164700|nr:hypothetical protein [Escherichia coli]